MLSLCFERQHSRLLRLAAPGKVGVDLDQQCIDQARSLRLVKAQLAGHRRCKACPALRPEFVPRKYRGRIVTDTEPALWCDQKMGISKLWNFQQQLTLAVYHYTYRVIAAGSHSVWQLQ